VVRLFFSWIVLAALAGSQFSLAECTEALKKILPQPSPTLNESSFRPWSIQDQNLKLTARDLFPEDFVKDVEQHVGPFEIKLSYPPKKNTVTIEGRVNKQRYLVVSLIQDHSHPGTLLVDNLNLQNPLEAGSTKGLNPDQSGKGLPPQVFRYVRNQLFELSKAGGYEQIRTHSQQHFAVMMLYRRFVGMEPANEATKAFIDEVESLYSFARKELPEELRPADVEEFTRWLGTVNSNPMGRTKRRELLLNHFFQTGDLAPFIRLLKNKEGKLIGAHFQDDEKAEANIVFFTNFLGNARIFDWLEVAVSHRIDLIKKL